MHAEQTLRIGMVAAGLLAALLLPIAMRLRGKGQVLNALAADED